MNNYKSSALAIVGILCLAASFTLNIARAKNTDAPTIVSSTAHFNPDGTYLLTPANGTGQIKCKVAKIDGAWLKCEGQKFEWVNIDTIMYATDSP